MRDRRPSRRGGGGVKGLAPNPSTTGTSSAKMKDRHREWCHSHLSHGLGHHRSSSPAAHKSPRRCSPDRRRSSVERRDYNSSQPDHHGKQLQHDHHRLLSQTGSRAPRLEDEGYQLPPSNMLPEHGPDREEALFQSKHPRSIKERDPHRSSGALSSLGFDESGLLVQRPTYLDNDQVCNSFVLPPSSRYLPDLVTGTIGSRSSILNSGTREVEGLRYRDLGDAYEEETKHKKYSRNPSFAMTPSLLSNTLIGASSASLAKDDFIGLYRDHHRPLTDEFGRVGTRKYSPDLDHPGYASTQQADTIRRVPLSPPTRQESWVYNGYHELGWREKGNHEPFVSDNSYPKMSWGAQARERDGQGSSFMSVTGDRVPKADLFDVDASESRYRYQHRHLTEDEFRGYREVKGVHEDYIGGSGGGRFNYGIKSSRDPEHEPFDESYRSRRDADHHVDVYGQYNSSPRQNMHINEVGIDDVSPERISRKRYAFNEDSDITVRRSVFSNDRNAFGHNPLPDGPEDMWNDEAQARTLPSEKREFRYCQRRMPGRRLPATNERLLASDCSVPLEDRRGTSLKRRLKPVHIDHHESFSRERGQEICRPSKYWKRGLEHRHGGRDAHHKDVLADRNFCAKTDAPEGSEEFKHQVEKAFLRFIKVLNESSRQQRRYREQGKAGNLLCCVCGSLSKEFVDTHSLVAHSYHSHKVGLRADHLGLHKALCVLMGWNWLLAPDNPSVYQSRPVAEVNALKDDLILWPPIVVIHNSSIGSKNVEDDTRVVTTEGMGKILQGMGFEAAKTRVGRGKPANQSVLIVKFMPTLSGLQEAERLHKFYIDNTRGKEELQQMVCSDSKVEHVEKVEVLLYGYMATTEDLCILDSETMKRCVVKSKKEIEAIADAPLNTD